MPKNTEKHSSRNRLVAALEAQIRKQDEMIRTQEETIQLLTEYNNELTTLLDKFFQS